MRKICLIFLFQIGVLCFAQINETLASALDSAGSYIALTLPKGTRVLLFKAEASSEALSAYISGELSMRLVNNSRFTVIERNPAILTRLRAETDHQLSGNVSDETTQSIGRQLGAETVISAHISQTGDTHTLEIKLINVETVKLLGQKRYPLQKEPLFESLLVQTQSPGIRPNWILAPLEYGRAKYENTTVTGISSWYYDSGMSNRTASEQTANTRARQNIQANIAANIASEFKARLDITESSLFRDSAYEDVQRLIETAITNSIKTRIPRYEILEGYIETGIENGRTWYISYVLARFPRKDIITVIESLKPETVAETVISEGLKDGTIPRGALSESAKTSLIEELEAVREYALEGISEALTGN